MPVKSMVGSLPTKKFPQELCSSSGTLTQGTILSCLLRPGTPPVSAAILSSGGRDPWLGHTRWYDLSGLGKGVSDLPRAGNEKSRSREVTLARGTQEESWAQRTSLDRHREMRRKPTSPLVVPDHSPMAAARMRTGSFPQIKGKADPRQIGTSATFCPPRAQMVPAKVPPSCDISARESPELLLNRLLLCRQKGQHACQQTCSLGHRRQVHMLIERVRCRSDDAEAIEGWTAKRARQASI